MKATSHEMAFIHFTRGELDAMIKREIMAKFPHLFTDLRWEWEECWFSDKINTATMKDEDEAIHCTFARREEPLKAVDGAAKVVYVAVNEVCR